MILECVATQSGLFAQFIKRKKVSPFVWSTLLKIYR